MFDRMVKGDLSDVVLTYDGSNSLRHRYVHGPDVDQVLADEDDAGEVLWPLPDHLGTICDLADYNAGKDATSIANHLTYDSFGRIVSETDTSKTPHYAFTGREWDEDAELYWYRARWYDARVGRFISEDPFGFSSNDTNLLRYIRNNPISATDPNGLAANNGCTRAVIEATGCIIAACGFGMAGAIACCAGTAGVGCAACIVGSSFVCGTCAFLVEDVKEACGLDEEDEGEEC